MNDLNVMLGETFVKVEESGDELVFISETGDSYRFYHSQDCCESVDIEDIIGDLDDLTGSPLLMAEEVTNADAPEDSKRECQDSSSTWTFYKFATVKGYVTVRWYGESNGYYSESVDFEVIPAK